MKKRIVSISPWQLAKNMAVLYFAFGVLFVIPIGVLTHFAPDVPSRTSVPGRETGITKEAPMSITGTVLLLWALLTTLQSAHALETPPPVVAPPAAPAAKDDFLYDSDDRNIVKKSRTNICHDRNSSSFDATVHYKAYRTMKACLDGGGRLPK